MAYRDDAFFNLANIEPRAYGDNDNANFMYPDNQIRFLAAQSALDGTNNPYNIKRGYIRGLAQPGLLDESNFTSFKCSFQFNPQTIQQTVIMSQDTYLPLLQDPYQFSQPMGKSTNFQFDLLFDRSREVAKGMANPGPNSPYAIGQLENGVNYKQDVYEIGALADLQLLYAIIGQGFSKELIDFQVQRLAQAAITEYNANGGGGASTSLSTTATTIASDGSNVNELAKTAVQANFGNSAFIIPAPVRVMFSSLFMVDGFVTGTTVDFLKFSTNMVPLQIRVGISMEAMYIGFARKKTFLTDSLEKAGDALKQQQQEEAAQTEAATLELKQGLAKYLPSMSWGWSSDSSWTDGTFLPSPADPNNNYPDQNPILIYELIFKTVKPNSGWKRQLNIGFKDAIYSALTSTASPRESIYIGRETKTDPATGKTVKDLLLNEGEPTIISYQWDFAIWGPFTGPSDARLSIDLYRTYYSEKKDPPTQYLVGSYIGKADSSDEWFFAKTFTESNLKNGAIQGFAHTGKSDSDYITLRNSYYMWRMTITAKAMRTTATGPVSIERQTVKYGFDQGLTKIRATSPLPWGPSGRATDFV